MSMGLTCNLHACVFCNLYVSRARHFHSQEDCSTLVLCFDVTNICTCIADLQETGRGAWGGRRGGEAGHLISATL